MKAVSGCVKDLQSQEHFVCEYISVRFKRQSFCQRLDSFLPGRTLRMCGSVALSIRIVNIRNSLHEFVVTANTIDCFKTRLDKFWNSQDVKFVYKQNLTELHNSSMTA